MMLVALVALALAPAPAPAPEPVPDAEAGVKAFAEGRYADAAEILASAYRDDPRPELLFAWAQAERYAGDCERALPLYRQYLEGNPPEDVQGMAREAIEECVAATEPEPEPVDDAPVVVAPEPEPVPVVPPPAEPPPRPALRDGWGHGLTWSGVALGAVGAGLLGEAHRRRRAADGAVDERAYRESLRGAPMLSRVGIGVVVGGAALMVAGVVRFAVLAARQRPEPATALQIGAGGVTWKFELAPRGARALR